MSNTNITPRVNQPSEKKFSNAPANYIPGLGRGATGFTTRSDIGPARVPSTISYTGPGTLVPGTVNAPPIVSFGAAPANYVAGRGRGAVGFGSAMTPAQPAMPGTIPSVGGIQASSAVIAEDEEVGPTYMDTNFDAWSGFNETGLFSTETYEADDREADEQWDMVDKRLEQRRKKKNKTKEKETQDTADNQSKISHQFTDLKRKLTEVTDEEWSKIPEIGDRAIKRRKFIRHTAAPDTLLERAQKERVVMSNSSGAQTDLRALGEAKESIIRNQLQKAEDSVSGQTNMDPKQYLTGLNGLSIIDSAELGDLERARELLKSVTTTNPTHAPAWIARARVEEIGAKIENARKYIMEGCEKCGAHSEDIWLEAARLHPPKIAKNILAQTVKVLNTNSVNIWLAAANLETSKKAKKNLIRKALEVIPDSVLLWKEAVELEEDEDDARILLSRAVECIPQNVDLWLALARLETYKNAKIVLNKARKQLPTEPLIWIAAAELEEAQFMQAEKPDIAACQKHVQTIIKKAIEQLSQFESVLNRENWLNYAKKAEEAKHIETCRAIIHHTIGLNLEQHDKKHTWIEDANNAIKDGRIEAARSIYAHALAEFPQKKGLWRRAAQLEKEHGSSDAYIELLKRAVKFIPQEEEFWLLYAKEMWKTKKDVVGARQILEDAFSANPESDNIWLAAVKLEFESGEFERARKLLEKARSQTTAARVWMKSAVFERNAGNYEQEWKILEQGIAEFPNFDKLWIMAGQWHERNKNYSSAREFYLKGLVNNPKSIPLWLCAAKLELITGSITRARSVLEKARLKNPSIPELWLASVRVEQDPNIAKSMLAKGLQACPKSGLLWAYSIERELRAKQKAQARLALEACDQDPLVIVAVARLFWRDRKLDKARPWLNRAIALDKDLGDIWINLCAFELEHGTETERETVLKNCELADPHHGELWTSISKDVKNQQLSTREIVQLGASKTNENLGFTTYVSPKSQEQ